MKKPKIVLKNGLSIEASDTNGSIRIIHEGKEVNFTFITLKVIVEKTGSNEGMLNYDLNDLLLFKLYSWKKFNKGSA